MTYWTSAQQHRFPQGEKSSGSQWETEAEQVVGVDSGFDRDQALPRRCREAITGARALLVAPQAVAPPRAATE